MFKRDISLNKYYRNLRKDVFSDLSLDEFLEVFEKFKKLNFDYKLLKICNFIERINIPRIEFPILRFFSMLLDLIRWLVYDLFWTIINGKVFKPYGLTCFVGRQGGGKTISMVEYLDRMKELYPDAIVITNFNYTKQDMPFVDWRQFTEVRNGLKGVIFAIDELQNEYNSNKRIKIIATTQVFTRVVKQLREQCYEVVECKTFFGRWTKQKCYDADDYNYIIDNPTPERKFRTRKKWKYSFVQSNFIRRLFDSYAVVESVKHKEFIDRGERS